MDIKPLLFKDAFISAFKLSRKMNRFLGSIKDPQRTNYMISHIYHKVADYLNLDIRYEYKNIDVTFYSRNEEYDINDDEKDISDDDIRIVLEHENNSTTAHEPDKEIDKLCKFKHPLKVLITYMWSEPVGWENNLFNKYIEVLNRNLEPASGPFLVIIRNTPEKPVNNELCWHYYEYSPTAEEFHKI